MQAFLGHIEEHNQIVEREWRPLLTSWLRYVDAELLGAGGEVMGDQTAIVGE